MHCCCSFLLLFLCCWLVVGWLLFVSPSVARLLPCWLGGWLVGLVGVGWFVRSFVPVRSFCNPIHWWIGHWLLFGHQPTNHAASGKYVNPKCPHVPSRVAFGEQSNTHPRAHAAHSHGGRTNQQQHASTPLSDALACCTCVQAG